MKPHALSTLCLALSVAVAQRDPPGDPGGRAPFVFEAGDIELTELVAKCGTYLQRNILIDEIQPAGAQGGRAARGRPRAAPAPAAADGPTGPVVTLDLPVVTDANGCEELLTGLLWSHGYALVPVDETRSVYEVLAISGPRAREIPMRTVHRTPAQVLARPALRQHVTVAYPLQHTNAMMATNALRPFFAQSGQQGANGLTFGNIGTDTTIILSGPQDMVASALRLLADADVEPRDPAAPPELVQRIEQLEQQLRRVLERTQALEEQLQKRGG